MSKVIRCRTTDATVMAMAMDATDMVAEAERIHHPSAVVTAALGRLLTASSTVSYTHLAVYKRQAYRRYCDIRHRLKKVDMDETLTERRLDLLRFQLEEIEGAALRPGEEETRLSQRTLYRNAERVASSRQAARAALSGDEETGGAIAALSGAASSLADAGRFMQELQPVSQRVEGLLYELEECAEDLRSYADQLDFDAEDLERTESRLEIIRRLTTKYGGSEEAALEFLEPARQELETIEMSDELAARLRAELETAREDLIAAAEKLTTARRDAAALFTRRVGEELAFLDMPLSLIHI